MGNPADAPGIFGNLWKRGGVARIGVGAWLTAFAVALSVGVLAGVAGNQHGADRHIFEWVAMGLGGLAVLLVVLGTYCAYRGSGRFPPGWVDESSAKRS